MLNDAQCVDPFPAIPQRQPGTGAANRAEIPPFDMRGDPMKNFSPRKDLPFRDAQSRHHRLVLTMHRRFKTGPLQMAAVRMEMRTDAADLIGPGDHSNGRFRIGRETVMNRPHILDEGGTVPLPAKPQQAKKGVGAKS